jgi:hypothetical protein
MSAIYFLSRHQVYLHKCQEETFSNRWWRVKGSATRSLHGNTLMLTTFGPIRSSSPEMLSNPAIMRRREDLLHPDGPTRMTNSPS